MTPVDFMLTWLGLGLGLGLALTWLGLGPGLGLGLGLALTLILTPTLPLSAAFTSHDAMTAWTVPDSCTWHSVVRLRGAASASASISLGCGLWVSVWCVCAPGYARL